MDTHDTGASEGWNGDTSDPSFQAHGWDGQGGVVQTTQYEWLTHELAAHHLHPTFLFMHHPPVAWLDDVKLESSQMFARIVADTAAAAGTSRIRGIFAGHVHQELSAELHGIGTCAYRAVDCLPINQSAGHALPGG